MKNICLLALALASGCNTSQKTISETATNVVDVVVDPTVYAQTITEEELKDHLYTYASDEFEGRETGEPGQKMAVDYLKAAYEAMEVPAAKRNGNYLQEVPLEMAKLPIGSIKVDEQSFEVGEAFLSFSAAEGHYNEIVYLAYGIEEDNYSDYQGMDVKDKVVLIKSGEPKAEDGTYKVSGTNKKSIWSNNSESLEKRLLAAKNNGAKAILYFDPANYNRFKRYFSFMKSNGTGRMDLKKSNGDPSLIMLTEEMAKSLLAEIETLDKAQVLERSVDLGLQSANIEIPSENVVAYIQGFEKPDEYLVISSHLDHIGISSNGKINNGADDDGSGTVAMLEIAEAFKKAVDTGNGPKRSIVFLHVTGEEKGLLGSQYYTDVNPVFPLSQTVANLNIDMIGRIDPKREGSREYIYLIGSDKLSQDLHQLSEQVNERYTQLELDYAYNDENDPNRFYYRSDHYNFAKNNIPIIFYFNGTHEDYHRPGDTPDKINYDLLTQRTQLIFHTAWEIANRDERVIVDNEISK
ncbi:MAG: M28 family peptidase [Flavobacteriaceae bacterium]